MSPRREVVGHYFGGPSDGATRVLSKRELEQGFVETKDVMGNDIRYTIVTLEHPKQVEDVTVTHELRPTEGVW